jgi:hypothetical protein
MRSFYMGHYDRCLFHTDKFGNINGGVSALKGMMLLFYQGIASFHTTKRVRRYTLKATSVHSINVLRKAAEDSK